MCRKISNIASREELESYFARPFKYPAIYEPSLVIDARKESTVSIVTLENPTELTHAIWGILPTNYESDWDDFNNAINTTNVVVEDAYKNPFFAISLKQRRCLIVATGFFIYRLENDKLYPFFVYRKDKKPLAFLGIYRVLSDGFITCALLKSQGKGIISDIQNLSDHMPLVAKAEKFDDWLSRKSHFDTYNAVYDYADVSSLAAHPISKDLFSKEIYYDAMLEPVVYDALPDSLNKRS